MGVCGWITVHDTCDTVWQFSRDGLITSAFVSSAIACVVVVIVVWCVFRKNWKDKYENQVQLEEITTIPHIGEEEPEREHMGKAKTCPLCQNDFGGFFSKNNTLCQACGEIVCTDCRTQEAYVPYMKKTSIVCNSCYEQLKPEEGKGERAVATSTDRKSDASNVITSSQPNVGGNPLQQPTSKERKRSKSNQKEGRFSSLSEGDQITLIGKEEPERDDMGKAKTCPLCHNDFGGFFFKNNTLCQACGKVVCTGCCTQETYVPYMKKTSKVCNSCYEQLKPEEGKGERAIAEEHAASADSMPDADLLSNKITSSQPNVGGNPPKQPTSKEQEGSKSNQKEGRLSSSSEGDRITLIGKEEPERDDMGKAKTCPLCQNDFGGFFFKNNTLCQACGKAVCTDCCTQEAYVPYMKKTSKVCKACYEQLNNCAAAVPIAEDQPTKVKRNASGVLQTDRQWEPDAIRGTCPVCNKTEFVWRLSKERGRNHCRVCGRVVCQACSSEEVYLQNYKGKERVCDDCWNDPSSGLQHREGSQAPETV